MLLRGASETFNFSCPYYRIHKFAKDTGVEFAVDESVPVPSDEEINKTPIEGNASTKSINCHNDKESEMKFLIKINNGK